MGAIERTATVINVVFWVIVGLFALAGAVTSIGALVAMAKSPYRSN